MHSGADRRQITALCYDLVESTGLLGNNDPEDLQVALRQFHTACRNSVEAYQGFVSNYGGDGAMVFFGYPQVHEDDPYRAINAGLEIIRQVKALRPARLTGTLAVRVGIA